MVAKVEREDWVGLMSSLDVNQDLRYVRKRTVISQPKATEDCDGYIVKPREVLDGKYAACRSLKSGTPQKRWQERRDKQQEL